MPRELMLDTHWFTTNSTFVIMYEHMLCSQEDLCIQDICHEDDIRVNVI